MPYHRKNIEKGVVGETSKIREELEELLDAEEQQNPVVMLLEMSDILGAIDMYLRKHHPTISIVDLLMMSGTTISAFQDGTRS